MEYQGHCVLCDKADTSSPICPECREKETTPAGGKPKTKKQDLDVLSTGDGRDVFIKAYSEVWRKLSEENKGVRLTSVQAYIESVLAGLILNGIDRGYDPVHIIYSTMMNARTIVRNKLDERGQNDDIL